MAVSQGIMELWQPESATMGITVGLNLEVGILFLKLACSSGKGVNSAIIVGWGLDGRCIHFP